jgi:hypothetical protein
MRAIDFYHHLLLLLHIRFALFVLLLRCKVRVRMWPKIVPAVVIPADACSGFVVAPTKRVNLRAGLPAMEKAR